MKQIAITGATAAFTKHFIAKFSDKFQITTIGRKNAAIIYDLLADVSDFVYDKKFDSLIHVAASFTDNNDAEILETVGVNALGTLKACMLARKTNVKHLILISSMSAVLDTNSCYYSFYAISKKQAEDLALLYCVRHNIKLTILRPSQIYDEAGFFRTHQPLLYLFADNAEAGKDLFIYGSHDAWRNYIHIIDLLSVVDKVIEAEIVGIYPVIYQQNIRLSEMASAALTAFGTNGKIIFLENKPDISDNIFEINDSIYEKTNYFPQIDPQKGMRLISNFRRGFNV
jgi:nucleoside-diphosphate-sugar epimerase